MYEEFITGRCDSRLSGSEGQLLFCGINQYRFLLYLYFFDAEHFLHNGFLLLMEKYTMRFCC